MIGYLESVGYMVLVGILFIGGISIWVLGMHALFTRPRKLPWGK